MPTGTPGGTLVGREDELALLAELIKQASVGRGASILILGEPGIGKSALVRAALADADHLGCEVFWGAGDELDQALPLSPLLDGLRVRELSIDPRRRTIVGLLRGEITSDRETDVLAILTEQLLALVAEQCAQRPTILVIDDLQWADQATIAFWARLAKSMRGMPLLLIGITRPVPKRDDLTALQRTLGDAAQLQLTALDPPDVAELVAVLLGSKPTDTLLAAAADAAGNPLYVSELVAALERGGRLTITSTGQAELTGESAPSSLSAAIADRLGFVSASALAALRAAALLGVEFAMRDLGIVLGRSMPDLIPAVDEACAAGVLTEAGGEFAFRHPMIRAALYDEIPVPVRAAWHREAGRALAEAGAPADHVARQLLRASRDTSEPLDGWMLDWLVRSAEPLAGIAPQVAAELLQHAAASSSSGSAQHDCLVSRLADALYRVGDSVGAEKVASGALTYVVEPDYLVDLHWTLAQCRMRMGRFTESLGALHNALSAPGISVRQRARLSVLAARTHANLGDLEAAGQAASAALEEATEADDSWAMGWALHVLTIVTAAQGQMTEALPLFDRALAVTQGDSALTDLWLLLQINKAVALGHLDRYDEAFTAGRQAQRLADRVGIVIRQVQAHSALGQLLFNTGRWDDAIAEGQYLPEDLKEPIAACCDRGIAAVICFHRGDIGAARAHLASVVPNAERIGNLVIGPLALARSLEHENVGALSEAVAVLTAGFAGKTEELDEVEDLLPDAVRLAAKAGDSGKTRALSEYAAILATGSDIPHRQANAWYCQGLLDHDPSRLLLAAQLYEEAGRPLLHAKALEAAAHEFLASGERSPARSAFTRAVEAFESLGAAADVAGLQASFREYGIRRGPRAKHRHASSGWDSLTPTEVKVSALVEEGLSNPEIAARLLLSRRTVATHVSHILRKLGVHSRIDIAREAAIRNAASS